MRRAFLRFFGQPPQSLRRSLRLIEGEPQETADSMS
ncbi:MAG: GlxA family transcriptional regulator, partial [Bradyrhizobium sp.]|nr:GlxA family transcriptional regulator [Bradyrhizobium sp.]